MGVGSDGRGEVGMEIASEVGLDEGLESEREGKTDVGWEASAAASLGRGEGVAAVVGALGGTGVVMRDGGPDATMASNVDLAAELERSGCDVGIVGTGGTLCAFSLGGMERGPLSRRPPFECTEPELERD